MCSRVKPHSLDLCLHKKEEVILEYISETRTCKVWRHSISHHHWTSEHEDLIRITSLLENGADVNEIDINGHTLLIHAIRLNHRKLVDILLQFKADVNHSTWWSFQVHSVGRNIGTSEVPTVESCCYCCHITQDRTFGILQHTHDRLFPWSQRPLFGMGGLLKCRGPKCPKGNTPLHIACHWKIFKNGRVKLKTSPSMVDLLLSLPQCDIEKKNACQQTALDWTVEGILWEIRRIHQSAQPSIPNIYKLLHIVKTLLKAGSQVKSQNILTFSTPLTSFMEGMVQCYQYPNCDKGLLESFCECLRLFIAAGSPFCQHDFQMMNILRDMLSREGIYIDTCKLPFKLEQLCKLAVRNCVKKPLLMNMHECGLPQMIAEKVILLT